MATYNGAAYIQEQLDSFLAQTRLPDEVIVSDDGSVDATVDFLYAFRERAPFKVQVLVNDHNLGYAQNFSQALAHCSGDIVFLSDQDDVWLPNKIERMLDRFAHKPKLQLLIHDLAFCKADLTLIGQTKIERMRDVFDLEQQYVVGMATAVRREFLQLCLPVPQRKGVSHDMWLHRCAAAVEAKGIMHDVLALYRRHASNATSTGDLNVDFVTTPDHFKKGGRAIMFRPTKLSEVRLPDLYEWLQDKRQAFIDSGIASAQRIDAVIAQERDRDESLTARAQLLAMHRIRRVVPVFLLLMRGGYKYFNGWKSAIKDILLN